MKYFGDSSEDTSRDWLEFILAIPVALFAAFFASYGFKWLANIDTNSALWTLNTQTQATAAFFGLLIAAVVFRLHSLTAIEMQLRESMHKYIRFISGDSGESNLRHHSIISVYDEYNANVIAEKLRYWRKQRSKVITDFTTLGKLWVIKELSSYYNSMILPPRFLRRGQTKLLYTVDIRVGESAKDMWEHYFTRQSEFILEMLEVLTIVCSAKSTKKASRRKTIKNAEIETTFAKKYPDLEVLRLEINNSAWKFEADRLKRTRHILLPRFHVTCFFLFFAVLLGMFALIGINNVNTVKDVPLSWLVGLPIVLSTLGFTASLAVVIRSVG